jgi:hypothetical protein
VVLDADRGRIASLTPVIGQVPVLRHHAAVLVEHDVEVEALRAADEADVSVFDDERPVSQARPGARREAPIRLLGTYSAGRINLSVK